MKQCLSYLALISLTQWLKSSCNNFAETMASRNLSAIMHCVNPAATMPSCNVLLDFLSNEIFCDLQQCRSSILLQRNNFQQQWLTWNVACNITATFSEQQNLTAIFFFNIIYFQYNIYIYIYFNMGSIQIFVQDNDRLKRKKPSCYS